MQLDSCREDTQGSGRTVSNSRRVVKPKDIIILVGGITGKILINIVEYDGLRASESRGGDELAHWSWVAGL